MYTILSVFYNIVTILSDFLHCVIYATITWQFTLNKIVSLLVISIEYLLQIHPF